MTKDIISIADFPHAVNVVMRNSVFRQFRRKSGVRKEEIVLQKYEIEA